MIQEMFEYYFEQKTAENHKTFVPFDYLKRALSFKLDVSQFTQFI